MNKQIWTSFVLIILLVIVHTNGNYQQVTMQGGNPVMPLPGANRTKQAPAMPGAYSAVMWAGPMLPGHRPSMPGANPMMARPNSVVAGVGHMIPRADVMMSGVAHDAYSEREQSALRAGGAGGAGSEQPGAKSRLLAAELLAARQTTRRETYYEPYYKDGHWVFNRKPTDANDEPATKKSANDLAAEVNRLQADHKTPTTVFECDQICPQVYAKSGRVCGMILEQYWHRWYVTYWSFDNLCILKIRNCNKEERWHYVHRGECPESYYSDSGYGWYATDPLDTWGLVSRALHLQGNEEKPDYGKNFAMYTNWWDVWRRSGNEGNYTETSNTPHEDRITIKRKDIGWETLTLDNISEESLPGTSSKTARSRRRIVRGFTQSMRSSVTGAPSRSEIMLTTARAQVAV